MIIHHLRNASMIIESNDKVIMIDPMIGPRGTMLPFAFIRFKAKRNPTVDFPKSGKTLLNRVTHCLITHLHPDHLDKAAEKWLRQNKTPVICNSMDSKALTKKGLNVTSEISYWQESEFLNGKIIGISARHGYGFVAKPAGIVMGYYIELPGEPSLYLSSDTIYTKDVKKALETFQPDISVVAAGSAQFDIFKPLLMTLDDVLAFTKDSPGHMIANHMEAVNHCPSTRELLKSALNERGLLDKTWVPNDGDSKEFIQTQL